MSAGSAVRDLPANTHWLRGNAHQTDARNNILDCFGRSDRRTLANGEAERPRAGASGATRAQENEAIATRHNIRVTGRPSDR
jgi:hypothetical protein